MSKRTFRDLFPGRKPLIACIHLWPLPGSPDYGGDVEKVVELALDEARIFSACGVDGLIVENFRDTPFYPGPLPPETIAAMTAVTREVKRSFRGPVGVNALRNDAHGALAIAQSGGADFIRVNIHTGAALTDQGIIEGRAWETLRVRSTLRSDALILADVRVKHATPLGNFSIAEEVRDAVERGKADGIIASGPATGKPVDPGELNAIRQSTFGPLIIGSGVIPQNIASLAEMADGFIVGSYFKRDGKASNPVDEERVKRFTEAFTKHIGQL